MVLQELEAAEHWWCSFATDYPVFHSATDGFRSTLAKSGISDDAISGVADLLARDVQSTLQELSGWARLVVEAIYDEVIACYGTVDASEAGALYRGFLGVLGQFDVADPIRTIPFFTLNYDIAVEQAAYELDLRLVDGFSVGKPDRRWTPKSYEDYVEDSETPTVVLVKLHGSVRLGRRDSGELIELPIGSYRDPAPHHHALLYPSLGPKALGEEPFRTNYSILRSCLMHAELCVVIGTTLRTTNSTC
ncbi:MAG: hypothetical protein JWM85_1870 [Acidimicrobiaceae bacterium]|nr:hypothetical protein [Acidimicrobiaceae bacterium]